MTMPDLWNAEPGYLDTASYGLPPRAAADALAAALADWRSGRVSWEQWDRTVGPARERFARLVGVPAADVAVGATVSEQLAPVAAALDPGSRVLVPEGEYTSNLFPWLVQRERGVRVSTVPLERLADAIDGQTTLVAFSLVSSASGAVAPHAEILAAARHHGAFVVVDGTQACGWLPFDASTVDVFAVHAYKWLMCPRGASFAVLAPRLRERVRPLAAGWYAGEHPYESFYGEPLRLAADARRFDTSPAWFSWVAAERSLAAIEEIGIGAIHAHDVECANRLRAGLGLESGDSAIVSVEVPGGGERLARAGIRASRRDGRIRLSCHVYTSTDDVDRALDALGDPR